MTQAVLGRLQAARGGGQLRLLAGRAGWNLGDQLVSSGTNAVMSFLVARALSADAFGAFAIAFTVYTFLVSAARSLIFQPLVVRYTDVPQDQFREASAAATGCATVLGIASGLLTAVVGLVFADGVVGSSLVCIGILLPGLLLQDMWRLVFIAEGRPAGAFVNDVVWAVVQLSVAVAIIATGHESASTLVLGWGGAATVAALVGARQFRGAPALLGGAAWLRRQKDLLGYYAASFFAVMGANQVTMLLIAGIGAPADLGALRAAAVVLGPLHIAGYSLSAFAMPELSRRRLRGREATGVAVAMSAALVAVGVAWGVVLLATPDSLGVKLLGDTWSNARAVLPASLAGIVAIGVGFGPATMMMAHGYAKESFRTNVILAPSFLILGVLGLQLWAAPGAAAGFALAQWIVAPVVWWRLLVLLKRETASDAEQTLIPTGL